MQECFGLLRTGVVQQHTEPVAESRHQIAALGPDAVYEDRTQVGHGLRLDTQEAEQGIVGVETLDQQLLELAGVEQAIDRNRSPVRLGRGLPSQTLSRPADASVELLEVDAVAEHVVGPGVESGRSVTRAQVVIGQKQERRRR